MTTTPHGQVPEALIDLIDAYAETRHRCGGIYNAKTEAARKAVIEALSGVQALSAAPAIGDELRDTLVAVSAAIAERDDRAAQKMICEILAASTTPPAEQQAQPGAVYAELYEPDATTVGLGAVWNRHSMRDFADRTHALRMQAAPKAVPGEQNTVPAEWLEQAYREGWAACRDAETIGEEAEDWAFGNSTANSRMIDAQQAAPQQEAPVQVSTQWLAEMIMSDCGCSTQNQRLLDRIIERITQYESANTTPQPAPDCHHRPPCDECAAIAAQRGNK